MSGIVNEIVEYGCVKEWDQQKKKAIRIEDSKYNAATKKALKTFDRLNLPTTNCLIILTFWLMY